MFSFLRSKPKTSSIPEEEKSLDTLKQTNPEHEKFKELPIDIVLEILDHVCGDAQFVEQFSACHDQRFDRKLPREVPFKSRMLTAPVWDANMDFNGLKFDKHKFFKQYFGKFPNRDSGSRIQAPRLIFRKLQLRVDRYSPIELNWLINIVNYGNLKINIDKHLAHQLFQCIRRFEHSEDKELVIEKKMLKYLKSVFNNGLTERVVGLDISSVETFPSLINNFLFMCPNIEKISLGAYYMKDSYFAKVVPLKDISESLKSLKHLKSLKWIGHNFFDPKALYEISKNTPLLEKLILSCETCVTCCHEAILNWKNLRLIVSKVHTPTYNKMCGTLEDQSKFFENLNQLEKLEKFVLNESVIREGVIKSLPPSLTCLNFRSTDFPNNFLQIVGSLPKLKVLGLDCYHGGREHLKYLIALKDTLEELHLTQSFSCGDEGVGHVSQIESLKRLLLQNLSQDQINDEGGLNLAKLKNLEVIGLEYCYITHKTVNAIAEQCPNIKKIHIDGCSKVKTGKLSRRASTVVDNNTCYINISDDID